MPRLALPGFAQTALTGRIIDAQEELREGVDMPGCEAQLFVFSYPPGQVSADHTHEETRITLVRSGRIRFTLGGRTTEIGAGDMVLIPAGETHRFEALGEEAFHIAELVIPAPCGKWQPHE